MKKLLSVALYAFLSFNASIFCQKETIENTGLYGVYVESMPFWTFWNRNAALVAIAQATQSSTEEISAAINMNIPVLYTRDYKEAEQLKEELLRLNCDLEIREMHFVFDNEQEAKEMELRLEMEKDAAFFDSLQGSDLVTARLRAIEYLKGRCSEKNW